MTGEPANGVVRPPREIPFCEVVDAARRPIEDLAAEIQVPGVTATLDKAAAHAAFAAGLKHLSDHIPELLDIRKARELQPLDEDGGSRFPFVAYEVSTTINDTSSVVVAEGLPKKDAPGERMRARAAAVIATTEQFDVIFLEEECGCSKPTAIATAEYMQRKGVTRLLPAGRKSKRYGRTKLFDVFVTHNPLWQREIRLRTLAHELGTDRNGAIDFLLQLGGIAIPGLDSDPTEES